MVTSPRAVSVILDGRLSTVCACSGLLIERIFPIVPRRREACWLIPNVACGSRVCKNAGNDTCHATLESKTRQRRFILAAQAFFIESMFRLGCRKLVFIQPGSRADFHDARHDFCSYPTSGQTRRKADSRFTMSDYGVTADVIRDRRNFG